MTAQATNRAGVFPLSALTGEGVEALLAAVSLIFEEEKTDAQLQLGFAEGKRRAWLHGAGLVQSETQTEDGWQIDLRWTARQEKRYSEI